LARLATEAKSNPAVGGTIPRLLELQDSRGTTVTIDAEGCQKAIARQILDQGGDYVLALKGNHPTFHDEVRLFMDQSIASGFKDHPHDVREEVHGDHGRVETRRTWVAPVVDWLEDRRHWPGINPACGGTVEYQCLADGKTTVERRYFISSLNGLTAQDIAQAVRLHWQVENGLHWVLDAGFHEDQRRIRKDNAAENFSRLRRYRPQLCQPKQDHQSRSQSQTSQGRLGRGLHA
jgi:predicted transposase YbfD/YdcC